jgi:threonine/homoserine/homoserine lactone efflux protein
MGHAIGGSLPLAIGVALSPIPIIAVVLMLTTAKARANGPAFVLGWLFGLGVVGAAVLVIAGSADASRSGTPATWVSWLKIVLGVGLLLVALRQFRGRPRDQQQAPVPRWMGAIADLSPGAALGAGALLAAANPKNLLLAVASAAAIAQTGIPGGQQAVAYLVFAVVATVGVAAPVVIYFAMGERSQALLTTLKDWMGQHNAVIMSVLCLIIAAKLIGDAIGGLT